MKDNLHNMPTAETTYQALSYTWGTATPTAPIICNGQKLEVTRNLYEALLYLRHRGTRILWIDAICIDQSNLAERSEQVQLMKQIYDSAISLVVWLGGGTTASTEGCRLLDYVNEQASHTLSEPFFDLKLFRNCTEESFDALASLLSRNWFSRVWIIQEVLSGKHRAMVYCGKTGRTWSHFMNGINAIAHRGLLNSIPDTYGPIQNVIQELQLFENVEPFDMDLSMLVSMARSAQATDPRDKVYALLNLAKDAESLHKVVDGKRIPFGIDYTKAVKEIYTDAAQAMVLSSGLQGTLTHARRNNPSVYDLPTWVPDWSISRTEFGIDSDLGHLGSRKRDPSEDAPTYFGRDNSFRYFRASQREGSPIFSGDETLQVGGIHFDDLKDLSGTYPGSASKGADLIAWLIECERLTLQCSPGAASGSRSEALWRTLIADRIGNTRPAPPRLGEGFKKCRQFLEQLQEYPLDKNSEEDLLSLANEARTYNAEMGIRCRARQLAVTVGRYMCLVPDSARIGDIVAIIDGCSLPTILRPSHGAFQLIGDCYVHGIMYGTAEIPVSRSLRSQRNRTQGQRREFSII